MRPKPHERGLAWWVGWGSGRNHGRNAHVEPGGGRTSKETLELCGTWWHQDDKALETQCHQEGKTLNPVGTLENQNQEGTLETRHLGIENQETPGDRMVVALIPGRKQPQQTPELELATPWSAQEKSRPRAGDRAREASLTSPQGRRNTLGEVPAFCPSSPSGGPRRKHGR